MGPTVRHQARLHPGGQAPQNAYVEQFDRSMRYEWLSQYHWKDLDRVQRFTTDWSWTDH
ncbi:integrase core domain-containing protein [Mycetohabitans endofungorum]|uniref:integrase core domain-containing protein n=1 Tax=Mycetohabitans endofungorum TaxID=417203 RepID=UPI00396A68B2